VRWRSASHTLWVPGALVGLAGLLGSLLYAGSVLALSLVSGSAFFGPTAPMGAPRAAVSRTRAMLQAGMVSNVRVALVEVCLVVLLAVLMLVAVGLATRRAPVQTPPLPEAPLSQS
jgi:hypothetical protein